MDSLDAFMVYGPVAKNAGKDLPPLIFQTVKYYGSTAILISPHFDFSPICPACFDEHLMP